MAQECGKNYIGMYQITDTGTNYAIMRLKCKSWDCIKCRPKKAAMYQKIIGECFGDVQLYFYTFTFYHSRSERETWQNYNKSWNRFNTAAHKKYGTYKYLKVLECHKNSNYPHIHLLTDLYIDPVWFGNEIIRAGFGWNAAWKRVSSQGACVYISKYLTKEWPRNDSKNIRSEFKLRIVTMSQGLAEKKGHKNRWYLITSYNTHTDVKKILQTVMDKNHETTEYIIDYDKATDWEVFHVPDWPEFWCDSQLFPAYTILQDPMMDLRARV